MTKWFLLFLMKCHSIFDIRRSTFDVRHSTFDVRHSLENYFFCPVHTSQADTECTILGEDNQTSSAQLNFFLSSLLFCNLFKQRTAVYFFYFFSWFITSQLFGLRCHWNLGRRGTNEPLIQWLHRRLSLDVITENVRNIFFVIRIVQQ